MSTEDKSDRDGRRRLLRCEWCGATLVAFMTDLLRYTREGWPKCCGQTMSLFVEEGPPPAGPSGTPGGP